ncbi:DnaJ domain-containing protein [Dioscorea alata]|uniref:DnaJ domain-containing protein n=1 Tax=Dioscorea alata TaxID=55571 RepID=A0ACB7V0E3_DIOAL|nr:DnaJ domain-containing protein [Dioscorea alata]
MDASGAASDGSCYYSRLGIRRSASSTEIRAAYRKLALNPTAAGEAKRRFQRIQEAYSVLSDEGKRSLYDAGVFDPFEDDDQDFSDFMKEMISMMDSVRSEKPDSMEDLQRMLAEMIDGGTSSGARRGPSDGAKADTWQFMGEAMKALFCNLFVFEGFVCESVY